MKWGSFAGGIAAGGLAGARTGYDMAIGNRRQKMLEEVHEQQSKLRGFAIDEAEHDKKFRDDLRNELDRALLPQQTGPAVDAGMASEPEYGTTYTPRAAVDTRLPEERVLAAAEATYRVAARHGKTDVLKQAMGDALQMRTALMRQTVDSGLRKYRLSGDPSGLFDAYNKYFPDGNKAKFLGVDAQGNARISVTGRDGKTQESTIPKDQIESTIIWLTNPTEMLKAQIADAAEARKQARQLAGAIALERVRGEEARRTGEAEGKGIQIVTPKDEEGNETVMVVDKRTGATRPAGGIAGGAPERPEGSFRKNERPVYNDIRELALKTEGLAVPNPMGGGMQFTPEGERVADLASDIYQYHRPDGSQLAAHKALKIAREGKVRTDANGRPDPAIMQQGGRIYAVPVVEWNGEQFQIGPRIDVTDRARQQQQSRRQGAALEGYNEGGFGSSAQPETWAGQAPYESRTTEPPLDWEREWRAATGGRLRPGQTVAQAVAEWRAQRQRGIGTNRVSGGINY